MSTKAATDRLSLTLPDYRTALKRRFGKKPPKPDYPWLFLSIFCLGWSMKNLFLDRNPFQAALMLSLGGIYWWAAWDKTQEFGGPSTKNVHIRSGLIIALILISIIHGATT